LDRCIVEDTPSLCGFSTIAKFERNKKKSPWVALELFYVYYSPFFETSLEGCIEEAYVHKGGK
jgi:hypothetical protein